MPDLVAVKTPPIKTQGIKTKLVPFILSNIKWDGNGRWIEPFLGSGVVLFNLCPERALVCDTNAAVIGVYQAIQNDTVTAQSLFRYLEKEGRALSERGEEHYYAIRERFNEEKSPLDFIFLNRSCFNGVVRFNRKGGFNVPFCRKPERFAPSLVTKICNQVAWVRRQMEGKDWEFAAQDWRRTLSQVSELDFVYLDPPYVGLSSDYYNQWSDTSAVELAEAVKRLPCGFAYSMWLENERRVNPHLAECFDGYEIKTFGHFYHVGATRNSRNRVVEALALKGNADA